MRRFPQVLLNVRVTEPRGARWRRRRLGRGPSGGGRAGRPRPGARSRLGHGAARPGHGRGRDRGRRRRHADAHRRRGRESPRRVGLVSALAGRSREPLLGSYPSCAASWATSAPTRPFRSSWRGSGGWNTADTTPRAWRCSTDGLSVVKRAGKLAELEAALDVEAAPGRHRRRWATRAGPPTVRPRTATPTPTWTATGTIAVIHNGIIENFQPLRDTTREGRARSGLRDRHGVRRPPDRGAAASGRSLADARPRDRRDLEGAYSLVVLSSDDPDAASSGSRSPRRSWSAWATARRSSPRTSPPCSDRTATVIPVEEGQVVEVRRERRDVHRLRRQPVSPEPITVDWDVARAQKGGFDDFMLKEIHEQPARDPRHAGRAGRSSTGGSSLDELRIADDVLREVDKVFVVACGTAFHSGLVAKYAIEHWTRLPVEIEIASEFRYRDPVLGPDTLTLAVSQSGETIDTLEAARHARRQGSQRHRGDEHGRLVARARGRRRALHARRTRDRRRGHQDVRDADGVAVPGGAVPGAGRAGRCSPRRSPRSSTRMDELPAQSQRAIALDEQVRELAERYQRRPRRAVHRPAHRVPGRAGGRAEAEGDQLRPRRGVSRRAS